MSHWSSVVTASPLTKLPMLLFTRGCTSHSILIFCSNQNHIHQVSNSMYSTSNMFDLQMAYLFVNKTLLSNQHSVPSVYYLVLVWKTAAKTCCSYWIHCESVIWQVVTLAQYISWLKKTMYLLCSGFVSPMKFVIFFLDNNKVCLST